VNQRYGSAGGAHQAGNCCAPDRRGHSLIDLHCVGPCDYLPEQKKAFDKIKHAAYVLQYQFGSTILLGFRKGICIGICKLEISMFTLGSGQRSWDHKDYEPVFRMP
jgi:hypothetical protein